MEPSMNEGFIHSILEKQSNPVQLNYTVNAQANKPLAWDRQQGTEMAMVIGN
jgi:hypothetical protein